MKNIIWIELRMFMCVILLFTTSVMNAQSSINAAGIEATGSGGQASISLGQVMYTSTLSSGGSVNEGVQQPLEIYWATGLDQIELNFSVRVYPNPTIDQVILDVPAANGKNLEYVLTHLDGQVLARKRVLEPETQISVNHLPTGTYFLSILLNSQTARTFKILKNN